MKLGDPVPWKFYKMPIILSSSTIAGYWLMQASYKCEFLLDYFVAKVLSVSVQMELFPYFHIELTERKSEF